jgi:gas vesicle protein
LDEIEERMMNCTGKRALPFFLTGFGTGVALALLFAPRSGEATRRLIGQKAKEGEGYLKNKGAAARDYVVSSGTEARNRVREAAQVIAGN